MKKIHWPNIWINKKKQGGSTRKKWWKVLLPKTFRNKIMWSIVPLVIIPVVFISLQGFDQASHIIEEKTQDYLHDISEMTISKIDDSVYQLEDVTLSMIGNQDLQQLLKQAKNSENKDKYTDYRIMQEIQKTLSSYVLLRREILSISIVSENGSTYSYSKDRKSYTVHPEDLERAYEQKGKTVWSVSSSQPGTIVMTRMLNHLSAQEPIGCIVITINERCIYDIFKNLEYADEVGTNGNGNVFLLDSEGIIVSNKDKNLLGTPVAKEINEVVNSKDNSFYLKQIDGVDYYVYGSSTRSNGWKIAVAVTTSYYMQDIQALRSAFFLAVVLIAFIAAGIAVQVSKTITSPLVKLSKSMERFGQGDFEVNCIIESEDEIGKLSHSFNQMVRDMNHLVETVYDQQLLNQEAKLKSLQMQINPHFLYNTLETINWMAKTQGNEDVGEMTVSLGKLMRFSLSDRTFITMREEMESLKNYFKIQKMRYSDKLHLKISVPEELMGIYLPKLLIQPIAENAIVHGIEEKIDEGTVSISAWLENEIFFIEVKDDGVGMSEETVRKILDSSDDIKAKSNGHTVIGIFNVNKRIKMYYGEKYGLQLQSKIGVGTIVRLRLAAYYEPPNIDKKHLI